MSHQTPKSNVAPDPKVEKAGHYGIFSGRRWRETICPKIGEFIRQHG